MTDYFAHSTDGPEQTWERLTDHLRQTAERAGGWAAALDAVADGQTALAGWAWLAGWLHDAGKASAGFQKRLRGGPKVDHATAGAVLADGYGLIGRLLSYGIAGHHSGLPDGGALAARKAGWAGRAAFDAAAVALPPDGPLLPLSPDPLPGALATGMGRAMLTRMLFSWLVDADRLETERFCSPDRSARRGAERILTPDLPQRLQTALEALRQRAEETASPLAGVRADILAGARAAAPLAPGFFSLQVPTGGGKTLASMAFALDHAACHGLRRVISVIPYTSIIEQNAAVYAGIFGPEAVLEHHSGFRDHQAPKTDGSAEDEDSDKPRLAEDNWDAPVVVTTSVQFFESLFATRPETCRKLHNIIGSVIVLDEAQMLPASLLRPCLEALRVLVQHWRCTVVFCTATQPELEASDWVRAGLPPGSIRPIIADPHRLHRRLIRVTVQDRGALTDAALVAELTAVPQAACIVNRRAHAATLAGLLRETLPEAERDSVFHLSARMCPQHRRMVLAAARQRLAAGLPCRIVATPVIECGVDIDLPVVWRALAGLDSLAQAAGRCNRELRRASGQMFLFTPDPDHRQRPEEQRRLSATRAVLADHADDPFSPAAMAAYFRAYYNTSVLDQPEVMKGVADACKSRPVIAFETMAERFRMIEDGGALPVLVPFDPAGVALLDTLRQTETPPKRLLRQAQAYTVTLYASEIAALARAGRLETLHGRFRVLDAAAYDPGLGVVV
ncbi:CRISPR-associated helicase Cas3' [Novispirillum itersonii]|uniref:CRISPR-associated endonuclease/helicase Cas3 n=1 Tax=Novispirillum itersonii TaxID=189 RepID=A0A7W9ZFV3_NOVIT|nr:CRISPR-associated helicase Cas3' [Novispirillum itersonii]MBB6210328.1 CRISPR-associated endonuclease/helicase Cas3 [Novispirillum itersonii]